MEELPEYDYRGARAMVILHDRYMRSFYETWRSAKAAGVTLPQTEDPDYASLETLLRHVLGCARGYLVWTCEQLELPDPGIRTVPEAEIIEEQAQSYLEHVLRRWRDPLAQVPEERFYEPEYASYWGTKYCIDAMLEHAVMHPIRHRFQLVKLMDRRQIL